MYRSSWPMKSSASLPPSPVVEELVLQPSEESLASGVVGRAPLPGHRPDDAALCADADPSGPSVVAASVAVAYGMLSVRQLPAGLFQHGVRQLRVRALPDAPRDGHPVEAVDHGTEYTLPAGMENCVMSVSHFSFGASAWKSRATRLSGAALISPAYEL